MDKKDLKLIPGVGQVPKLDTKLKFSKICVNTSKGTKNLSQSVNPDMFEKDKRIRKFKFVESSSVSF